MSLAVAVPLGIASALVYGTSIVVQHSEAYQHGQSDAKGLLALLRNPRWLMAVIGDFVGFLLMVVALSIGSVVVIQPLVVLMLPVALVVGWLMGGPRPRPVDYFSSFLILAGLMGFLLLIGHPEVGRVPRSRYVALTVLIVLIAGVTICLCVRKASAVVRGATYGGVAGLFFGTLAVMVDAASTEFSDAGVHGVSHTGRGLVPLMGIVLLGLGGVVLTQISFQVGMLSATLPANLALDPFSAVVIGALLLREHLPVTVGHVIGYAACLAAVIAGAIRLAEPATAPHPAAPHEPAELRE